MLTGVARAPARQPRCLIRLLPKKITTKVVIPKALKPEERADTKGHTKAMNAKVGCRLKRHADGLSRLRLTRFCLRWCRLFLAVRWSIALSWAAARFERRHAVPAVSQLCRLKTPSQLPANASSNIYRTVALKRGLFLPEQSRIDNLNPIEAWGKI